MISKKQTGIAITLAIVVVFLFVMLGFFGVDGFGVPNDENTAANSSSAQAILDELSETGTVSSLRSSTISSGTGVAAKAGDIISVHYIGVLPDGTVFDSSRERGAPFSFQLGIGQVIQGWDQGLVGSKVGDRFILAIPPELGYGERAIGAIPANATLIFDIEVLDISSNE